MNVGVLQGGKGELSGATAAAETQRTAAQAEQRSKALRRRCAHHHAHPTPPDSASTLLSPCCSNDPAVKGAPSGFTFKVREVKVAAGAGENLEGAEGATWAFWKAGQHSLGCAGS